MLSFNLTVVQYKKPPEGAKTCTPWGSIRLTRCTIHHLLPSLHRAYSSVPAPVYAFLTFHMIPYHDKGKSQLPRYHRRKSSSSVFRCCAAVQVMYFEAHYTILCSATQIPNLFCIVLRTSFLVDFLVAVCRSPQQSNTIIAAF